MPLGGWLSQTTIDAPLPAPGLGGTWTLTGTLQAPVYGLSTLVKPLTPSTYMVLTAIANE